MLEKGDMNVDEQKPKEQADAKKSAEATQSSDQHKLRHIGKPGIESASGRDRSKGELSRDFGTDEGPLDLSDVAPPPGSVEGSRVGAEGDPTGSEDGDEGSSPTPNS
jgi:hypothetical protein